MRNVISAMVVALAAASSVSAQFTLTTTDRRAESGGPVGVDASGKLVWRGADGVTTHALESVISVDSSAPDAAATGGFRVDLVGGDRMFGRLEDGKADELRLATSGLGVVSIRLDDVSTLWNRDVRVEEDAPPPPRDEDRLIVERDGRRDALPGAVDRITKNEVVFSSAAGERRPFAFIKDRVWAVQFANEARRAASRPSGCVVRFRDGSRLFGALKPGRGGAAEFAHESGFSAPLDFGAVRSLTMVNAAFTFLSDLEPASCVETPLIGGAPTRGVRRDVGVRPGEPLRIGAEVFTRGLSVPARTEMKYALRRAYTRFTARVGVDPATRGRELPGCARATILVDGKAAWTGGLMRAGAPPVVVDVASLSGASELTLRVEFGDSYDAGARVVFGHAMLLK